MPSTLLPPTTLDLFTCGELQDHIRFIEAEDKADADRKVKAAIAWCEEYTCRSFLTCTRRVKLRCFPAWGEPIRLDRPPWQSITSITYLDALGDEQALAASVYGVSEDKGHVWLKNSQSWPTTLSQEDAVTITYVSGWESAADVPEDIKQAVLFLFGHNFANREAVTSAPTSEVQLTVESYLAPWVAPRY